MKLIEQKYSCAICKISASELDRELSVDHDHATDKVRGLLCSPCNIGLGIFQDNIEFLQEAIKYLKKHRDAA
jgi:hypothetical protein